MSLETATWLSQLVATNPTSNDPKSQGDDHLRLLKSVLQNSFTNISGAVTKTHTELNSVTDRGFIAGQTWSGTHTFPATTYGVTAPLGDGTTKLATTEFVMNTALTPVLPGQLGKEDNILRSNGTVASWVNPKRPVFQSNAGVSPTSAKMLLGTASAIGIGAPFCVIRGSSNWIAVVSLTPTASTATSSDGITWVLRTASTTQTWIGLTRNGTTTLAWGSSTSGMVSTDDGVTWSTVTFPYGVTSCASVGGLFVITTSTSGTAYHTSPDGVTWTARVAPASGVWLLAKKTLSGNLIATSTTGTTYWTTPDGINWTTRTFPATIINNGRVSGVYIGSDGKGRVASAGVSFYDTSDGITWLLISAGVVFNTGHRTFITEMFGAFITPAVASTDILIGSSATSSFFEYSGLISSTTSAKFLNQYFYDFDTVNKVCVDGNVASQSLLIGRYSQEQLGNFL